MTAPSVTARIPWPPLLYLAAVAAAFALGAVWPLPWLPDPAAGMLLVVGLILAVAAVAVEIAAVRLFLARKTTVLPGGKPVSLVTNGPFALTRNPIYVGNTALTIALGLILGNAWFLPLAIVAALATDRLAVRPEEKQLEASFGRKYRDYKAKVRRWL